MKVGFIVLMVLAAAAVAEAQPSGAEANGGAETEARDRAEAAYDTAFIVFEDEYAAHIHVETFGDTTHGTVRRVHSAVPIRGIQRERLDSVVFYDAVGRSDLATEYESRRRKKQVIGGVSAGAFGLSLVLAGVALSRMSWGPDWDNCDVFSSTWEACTAAEERRAAVQDDEAKKWALGAGVALVGSLVIGVIHRRIDPHPVSESERRMLAHDHNERLRRELRLPRKRSVSLSPFVSADSGGLMAVGTF